MTKEIGAALLSLSGPRITSQEKELIKRANPLGFCFFGRNIENKKQLQNLTQEIKDLLEREDIIFAIDQEGGRVRRLHEPEFSEGDSSGRDRPSCGSEPADPGASFPPLFFLPPARSSHRSPAGICKVDACRNRSSPEGSLRTLRILFPLLFFHRVSQKVWTPAAGISETAEKMIAGKHSPSVRSCPISTRIKKG